MANGSGGVAPTPLTSLSQPNSLNSSLVQNASSGQPIKVTLTKGGKKDDYGVVLGCRLFVKEISSKAREQLNANGYSLQEGDIITRIHNTNCGDTMSLKEAKKIIDGCKERLNLVVLRDITNQAAAGLLLLNRKSTSSLEAVLLIADDLDIAVGIGGGGEATLGGGQGGGGTLVAVS
ncbi:GD11630 [Drosophila simulans]|uniref:GD11630 n=1 Tax=Drosophila simulans TaxID=7240 RepID=B4QGL8_DROSI|nr:GD11630 [Drosophila simulans]